MLIDKLDIVEKRYKEIYQLIGDPEIISNQKKYIELNKELEERNGMKNILYLVYGNFINLVGYHMVHTGIFGELNKK